MRQPIDWAGSRVSLRPTVLTVGGIAGSFLILHTLLAHTHAPLIHAVVRADLDVLLFLNGFARRSWWFDVLVRELAFASSLFFQGLMVALFWGAWFAPGDPLSTRRKRESLLSSLFGVYATAVLAIVLRATLPFRARPYDDATIVFQEPFSLFAGTAHSHSTSLPAGHAAVFFAVAIGLWSISVRLGLVGFLVALFAISLPRVYLGLHYPGDILIGAGLGLLTVVLFNETLHGRLLLRRILAWSEERPVQFYSFLFVAALDVATEFSYVRVVLRLLPTTHINKLVQLAIGSVLPA